MRKIFSVIVVLVLSVFLVSGCGKKASEAEPISSDRQDRVNGPSAPVTVSSFSPFYYASTTSGMTVVLTNTDYASWIQLSPTESTRVYVELYLEEKGTFKLSYFELVAGNSASNVLNEQTLKGDWKISGDKIILSDVATLTKKTVNGSTQLTIGFLKDIQTSGLKNKQTVLVSESRVYTALE